MEICKTCHGGCCRNFTVGLTGVDIINISKTLGVLPSSFVDVIAVEEGADIEHKSKHAALFRFSDFGAEKYYVLGIKMIESSLVPATAKCQFLLEWNSDNENPTIEGLIARCGIYSCRPLICAAFPTKFGETEATAVMVNTSAFEQVFEHPVYKTCAKAPSLEDISGADEIIKTLVLKKYEVEFFKKVAFEWNKNPQTLAEFWTFLAKIYQNRVVIE